MMSPPWSYRVNRKLKDSVSHNDDRYYRQIKLALVFIDQQWSQEEIMHQKQEKEYRLDNPHMHDFTPVEHLVSVIPGAHIHHQYWYSVYQQPKEQVDKVLPVLTNKHYF